MNKSRQIWALRLTLAAFVLAAMSQARVQVFQKNDIIDLAKQTSRFTMTRIDEAKRGQILSADGKPLAQDDETYEFAVLFSRVPQSDGFFMALGEASGIPASELSQLAAGNSGMKVWSKKISRAQAERIQKVKTEWRADGVSLKGTGKRAYPLGESAAGFVGVFRDDKPQSGFELSLNDVLAGQDGVTVGLIDRTGAFLPMRLDSKSSARTDGQSVTLTIDSVLQQEVTAALKEAVDSNKADSGVAIVLDPKTGDVLAMANWPSFSPAEEPKGINGAKKVDLNPNYMMVLEPGSTFKILTLAKGLEDGVVSPNETLNCQGSLQVWPTKAIRCAAHAGKRAHGVINPEMAIAKSCNVCASIWAARIGYDPMVGFLEDLGILDKSTLGLPLETSGQFNRNEYAKPLQLATVGFGQSVSATPIGLASAFAMLGNDGIRMKPRLIKKVGDKELPIEQGTEVVKPETARKVMTFMESVISSDSGTGKTLRIPGYRLAGKTGTAERVRKTEGGGYVANFVGFVPAEDPKALVLVMVDHPKAGRYYGGSVAGPVFHDVAKSIIRRFNIRPSRYTSGTAGVAVQVAPASQ